MYESRYTDIIAYENYLLDLELQQSDMTRYVNECVLLSGTDKRKAIEEMAIFNEGALGDKFKKVWARIKSFFAKIYQKFLESLQAWASDNIAYLKQYANIIFEKKCTLKTVKMQDHFEGQKNFDTMVAHVKDVFAKIPDLTSLEAITDNVKNLAGSNPGDKLSEKGDNLVDGFTYVQQTDVLQAIGMTNTKSIVDSSDLQGFAGRFRNWLNGGEEINEYSGSELEGKNMELMYNFLYKYDATVEKLKKIKDAFDTGMTAIETSFKKGYDAMSKSVKGVDQADVAKAAKDAADQSKSDESIRGTLASELRDASKEAKATKEAYSYVYGRAINEADIDSGNSNSNTETKTNTGDPSYNAKNNKALDTENKTARKQGTETASDVKSDANQIKGNAGGKGQLTAAELKAKGVSDENLSKYEDYALSMIRAWGNTRSLCMGAALNSLSDTRRDYFDVIRAHVRTWIGTTAGPDQNTDTKPTNTNATH
jgi:hypothetical protein